VNVTSTADLGPCQGRSRGRGSSARQGRRGWCGSGYSRARFQSTMVSRNCDGDDMKECCGRTPAECRRLPRVASRVVSGPVDKGRYLSVLSHFGGRPAGCPILSRRLSRPQPPAAPRLARAPSAGELSHSPESPNCRRHCEFLRRVATTLLPVHSVRPDICTMFGQSAIRHATSTNSTWHWPVYV
jgi:hypothetical protein